MLARAGSLLLRPRPAATVGCLFSCSVGGVHTQSKSQYSQWLPAQEQQHQQWNAACVVQARSASDGAPPSESGDEYQLLGEVAQFLLHEAKGASATLRMNQIVVASTNTMLNEYEKRVVISEIMKLLCFNFSFSSLAALDENPSALFAIRDTCREELGNFIHKGLQKIADMAPETRPVPAVLQLYSMLGVPTRNATDLVLVMQEGMVASIPDIPAEMAFVRALMRFTATLSYAGSAPMTSSSTTATDDDSRDRLLQLLAVITRKVAEGLETLPLPTSREIDIESKFATALVAFGARDADSLKTLVAYLERCVADDRIANVVQASRFLHCLSALRVPAKPLFASMGRQYHGRQCTWDLKTGVYEYTMLCWSYLAQGMQPPARGLQELGWQLRSAAANDEPLPKRCLVELLQLLAYLPEEVAVVLRPRLERDVVGKFQEARRLGRRLGEENKRLVVNQVMDSGLVTAAGLLDTRSRQWRQWPKELRAQQVGREDGYRLGAQPVALVALTRKHTLSRPHGAVGGLMERQRVLLARAGWLIVLMPIEEVLARRRAGTDAARWVEQCMENAACEKIAQREKSKATAGAEVESAGDESGDGDKA